MAQTVADVMTRKPVTIERDQDSALADISAAAGNA
jgi:hypothetical protein